MCTLVSTTKVYVFDRGSLPSLCCRVMTSGGEPIVSDTVVVRSEYMIPSGSTLATKCPRA